MSFSALFGPTDDVSECRRSARFCREHLQQNARRGIGPKRAKVVSKANPPVRELQRGAKLLAA
jgi:hypothetical protein